jgi:hypothetical protein
VTIKRFHFFQVAFMYPAANLPPEDLRTPWYVLRIELRPETQGMTTTVHSKWPTREAAAEACELEETFDS